MSQAWTPSIRRSENNSRLSSWYLLVTYWNRDDSKKGRRLFFFSLSMVLTPRAAPTEKAELHFLWGRRRVPWLISLPLLFTAPMQQPTVFLHLALLLQPDTPEKSRNWAGGEEWESVVTEYFLKGEGPRNWGPCERKSRLGTAHLGNYTLSIRTCLRTREEQMVQAEEWPSNNWKKVFYAPKNSC